MGQLCTLSRCRPSVSVVGVGVGLGENSFLPFCLTKLSEQRQSTDIFEHDCLRVCSSELENDDKSALYSVPLDLLQISPHHVLVYSYGLYICTQGYEKN